MKTTITHSEYLQLLGLAVLAADANKRLYGVVDSAGTILGTPGERDSHMADAFYSEDPDVDAALKKMGVVVEPQAEKAV